MICLANISPCLHVLCQGYMYAMQYPLTYLHVLAHKYCTYKMGLEQMFETGNHENYFIMVLSILYTFPGNIQEHIRKTYQYLYSLSRFFIKGTKLLSIN